MVTPLPYHRQARVHPPISLALPHQPCLRPCTPHCPTLLRTPHPGRRAPPVSSSLRTQGDTDTIGSGQRTVKVLYYRRDQNYQGWGLHVAGDPSIETDWQRPLPSSPAADGWVCWDLELPESGRHVELIVHRGEEKSVTCRVSEWQLFENKAVWLLAGEGTAYFSPPNTDAIAAGNLSASAAHWLTPDLLAWREPASDAKGPRSFALHWSATAGLTVDGGGLHGSEGSVALEVVPKGLPTTVTAKSPHLTGCTALKVPPQLPEQLQAMLSAQLVVVVRDAEGRALDATGVQVAGVLDCLFTYDGPLGCHITPQGVACHLWAPTAQSVDLVVYEAPWGAALQEVPMQRGDHGAWHAQVHKKTAQGPCDWVGKYYQYKIRVYCPWTQCMETSYATDPYSRSLAANSARSHIVDMRDAVLAPPGWAEHTAPRLDAWTDISVYELHVRDFSAHDVSVPEQLRGKYLAFAQQGSTGTRRLRELAEAGITHVHLLPSYDFGSVPERSDEQRVPEGDLLAFPPDSTAQQASVLAVADQDAFNWGYDPVHYGVPEGSYSTNPDGAARVVEFRSMVHSLHSMGLRVVLDVVYNHTFATGPHSQFSVLDKCVPGYYHRREENGAICMSTCCNNTASEHAMCERLIVDDVVHWVTSYKVDGFRFDIMGHHLCRNMDKIRAALDALTPEKDGVDGANVYIYGEAWDFGEMAFNQRGRNASQLNIAGTGLGSFNDRLRDAVLGGGPFAPSKAQGVVTGLFTDSNAYTDADMPNDAQHAVLLEQTDLLRLSLAGNLRDYVIEDCTGERRRGVEVRYCGSVPAAYAANPWESVNYTSCHDNQTLFDQVMMKAPSSADIVQRTRMCMLANAMTALSQGVAFFHAADDMLRSKSLDRDSYNSGDHFNRIDWTGSTNNFGVGLPVATKNEYNWPIMQPLLADTSMQPGSDLINLSRQHFLEMLRLRYSSPLFRLATAEDVYAAVTFHNTGPQQLSSGDVVGSAGASDEAFARMLVVFNVQPGAVRVPWPAEVDDLQLHPMQAASVDAVTASARAGDRVVEVPGRTCSVFVQPR